MIPIVPYINALSVDTEENQGNELEIFGASKTLL